MTFAPPCPACGRVEWLGDGVLITQDHARAKVARLTVPTRAPGARRWSCMACWHAVADTSHLHELLEEIATVGLGEREAAPDGVAAAADEGAETGATVAPADRGYRSDRDH